MAIDLYYTLASAPCRAVILTIKALNLDVNLKHVNLGQREHLKPEYLKLNPQHAVPTLVDDGFSVWESRAIMTYLANKYGKGGSLYPEDPNARAVVDQRLYFDIGTLYQSFLNYYLPIIFEGKPAEPALKAKIEDALAFLEKFLEDSKFAAGDNLTLADLSLIASVSSLEIISVDFKKYSNINRWFENVKEIAPGYKEYNEKGIEEYKIIFNIMTKKK